MTMTFIGRRDRIGAADAYLDARTGKYEWRCVRYGAAWAEMAAPGPRSTADVFDIGAGATEFGRFMFEQGFHGRYWPVDAAIDGCDLDSWVPPRAADWFVALELIEHLADPLRLLHEIQDAALRGVVISTPNPYTTDVLGMDAMHCTPIYPTMLEAAGFAVREASFYGQPEDSLLAVWRA